MSLYIIRTCFSVERYSRLLQSRNHLSCEKHQTIGLKLPCILKNSIKTSNWNHSRWPGRKNVINSIGHHSEDNFALNRLWKPFAFTVAVSGTSFVGAAIWQYETVRSQAGLAKRWWDHINPPKYGQFRQHMHLWWNKMSNGDKVFAPICLANVLVFLAWRVPAWQPMMTRLFTAGLMTQSLCWPMLLSTFSHYSSLHLAANMFVLHSFSDKAISALGKEQFVAMYLTGGLVSSFASYFYKAIIRSPTGSLGASGAVMCVLGFVCSKYPNSHLAIILIPQYPFEAGTGLKALLGLDTMGCLLRWTFFDHAAHLGGSLFGIFWHYWGYDHIWRRREPLISAWHKMRGPVQ